ncbi:MAG TPA: ribonuclease III [Bryobacteraceae bacterium]|nr:ribonuclease III [Bryobacteraceae bacterium]
MKANLDELEQSLGYAFRDRALLNRALTHSSSANELAGPLPEVTEARDAESPLSQSRRDNERLEFLGDSILGWVVSEWLFSRFLDFTEGQLSLLKNHLVSATHLLAAAHRLDLGRFLHLGRGEETGGGRSKQRLLVNAFEAVIAAVYLDGGADAARGVIISQTIPGEEDLMALAGAGPPRDFRAELDRLARDRSLPRPEYQLVGESGPGHARTFIVEARVGRDFIASAEGSSKKSASHNAARQVCELLRMI